MKIKEINNSSEGILINTLILGFEYNSPFLKPFAEAWNQVNEMGLD